MADIKVAIYLKNGEKIEFGKRYIQNLESLSQSNADPSSIFYGVLSSTGNLQILDIQGKIRNYIDSNLLDEDALKVELYINGSLAHSHISTNNNYDTTSDTLNIQLSDKLSLWKDIKVPIRQLTNTCNAFDLLKELFISIGYSEADISSMCSENCLLSDDKTFKTIEEMLKSIIIDYPYLEEDNFYNQVNKICAIAQLQCIETDSGDIKFISARPHSIKPEIVIPYNNQYSNLSYSLIKKNKVNNIQYNIKQYEYNYKQVFASDSTCSYYSQSNQSERDKNLDDDGEYIMYSGQLTDYKQEISNKSTNIELVGNRLYNQLGYSSDDFCYYAVFKATFQSSDISKDDNWFIARTTSNGNSTGHNFYPTKSTKFLLANIDNIGVVPQGQFGEYQYEFVKDEDTALNRLLTNERNYIVIGRNGPTIEIIKNGTEYIVYGSNFIPIMMGGDVGTEYYTGNLGHIIFYDNFCIYKKVLTVKSNETINKDATVSISDNELTAISTKINDEFIVLNNANMLLRDYKNGISDATITVSCANYYDLFRQKVIDFNKGELLKVGDVVKIQGNDKTWKITGRTFRYNGCPFIDLELMEVKRTGNTTKIFIDTSLSGSNQISFEFTRSGEHDQIDFGDGYVQDISGGSGVTHDYASPFRGVITFKGNFTRIAPEDNNTRTDILGVVMGDTITQSGTFWAMFVPSNCETFVLSNNLEEIEGSAFNGLSKVKEIIIPDSIMSIGVNAFAACSSLVSLSIPDSITTIPSGICQNCSSLQNITFSENVTEIQSNAFHGCKSLKSLKIPKNVVTVASDVIGGASLPKLIIDSPTIANLTQHSTFTYVDTIYVLSSITLADDSFIRRYHTFEGRDGNYDIYKYTI